MMNSILYKFKKGLHPFKAAIIAVVISVIASVGVSVISETGKNIISYEMESMGLNGLAAVMYNKEGLNMTDINFYNDIAGLEGTEHITPIIVNNAVAEFQNGKKLEIMGWGINNQAQNVVDLKIVSGRMINSLDIESNAKVCLIDVNAAKTIYGRGNICGKHITVNFGRGEVNLNIVGIIEKGSSVLNTLTGDIVPNFIYLPYSTMKSISEKSTFDQIIFTENSSSQSTDELKEKLEKISYKYRNKIIKLTNLSSQKEQITNIVDTAFLSLFVVSCVAVLVCSISVASSVNTAVISKQKDIGIKMSMGASRFDITAEFLFYAVMSCVVGITVAVTFIFAIVFFMEKVFNFNIAYDVSLIALSISVTIFLTTVFSFLPSYRAAKMPPIKALNRE